jgi:RNA polymerase sigma-70 factor, ECF subfamily
MTAVSDVTGLGTGVKTPFSSQDCDVDGVARSFHQLVVAALPALRRQAMALSRHPADAEDLVHATVSNALAAESSFELGTNFSAWVARILRNQFFTNARGRRLSVDLDDASESQLMHSGGQEEAIAFRELQSQLRRLPPKQLETLLMIAVDGLSYEEAAERLGIAVGTLKNRVFRARARLQSWMFGETRGRRGVRPLVDFAHDMDA